MLVMGFSGSLRRDSHNRRLLGAAARGLPAGVRFEEWRGLAEVPPYNSDTDGPREPATVRGLRESLARADAVLIATPEYNHSIPGQLKNAVDWASRPFPNNALRAKPVAVVGASTSLFGAVWAQAELRKVLGAAGAQVLDEELPVPSAHEAFDAEGSLRDPEHEATLRGILARLIDVAEQRSSPPAGGARETASELRAA